VLITCGAVIAVGGIEAVGRELVDEIESALQCVHGAFAEGAFEVGACHRRASFLRPARPIKAASARPSFFFRA